MDFTTDLVRSLITRPPPPLAAGKPVGPEQVEKDKNRKKKSNPAWGLALAYLPICCDFSLFYFYYCIPVPPSLPPPKNESLQSTHTHTLDLSLSNSTHSKNAQPVISIWQQAVWIDSDGSQLSFHLLCSTHQFVRCTGPYRPNRFPPTEFYILK